MPCIDRSAVGRDMHPDTKKPAAIGAGRPEPHEVLVWEVSAVPQYPCNLAARPLRETAFVNDPISRRSPGPVRVSGVHANAIWHIGVGAHMPIVAAYQHGVAIGSFAAIVSYAYSHVQILRLEMERLL